MSKKFLKLNKFFVFQYIDLKFCISMVYPLSKGVS